MNWPPEQEEDELDDAKELLLNALRICQTLQDDGANVQMMVGQIHVHLGTLAVLVSERNRKGDSENNMKFIEDCQRLALEHYSMARDAFLASQQDHPNTAWAYEVSLFDPSDSDEWSHSPSDGLIWEWCGARCILSVVFYAYSPSFLLQGIATVHRMRYEFELAKEAVDEAIRIRSQLQKHAKVVSTDLQRGYNLMQ